MIRSLYTAALCALAVFVADVLFRTSVLQYVRPIILTPTYKAVLLPPVELRWSGPQAMRVVLAIAGGDRQDLGIQKSPFEISADNFPRDGGYEISVEAPRWGGWIRAQQVFQLHSETPEVPAVEPTPEPAPTGLRDLTRALASARATRNRSQDRVRFLREENRTLQTEKERLAKELETAYATQDDDAERFDHLQEQGDQLAEENRVLADALAALRLRLASVISCTVWGYYGGYPVHGSSGARRTLVVSDAGGQVFRLQPQCEMFRVTDSTAASPCFCIGNSWGP